MSKLTIRVECFTPRCNNTLRGFAMIRIEEPHLLIHDVAIHTKNGATWVQLPMRPWTKDGRIVTGDDGKAKYFPVVEFTDKATRDAFNAAVVRALRAHNPRALECRGAVS